MNTCTTAGGKGKERARLPVRHLRGCQTPIAMPSTPWYDGSENGAATPKSDVQAHGE